MKALLATLATAGFVAAIGLPAQAQTTTPGHQMQEKGSVSGTTGASGYSPGHQMQEKGSVKGTTGASGYAPGQTKGTTGAGVKSDADVKIGTTGTKTDTDANVKGSAGTTMKK